MGRVAEPDYERLLAARTRLREFEHWSAEQARAEGLTAAQHQLMLAVRGHPDRRGPTIGEVAGYLLVRHHTAVELVDRMTGLKILSRSIDRVDGRRVVLTLTKEGERRLQKLSKIHLEELRAIEPTLTALLRPFHRPARGSRAGRP